MASKLFLSSSLLRQQLLYPRLILVFRTPVVAQATSLAPAAVEGIRPLGPCRAPTLRCPPPPCACPPPAEPVTLGTRLLRLLWLAFKLGLFVGVVKLTIDEGLWGSSEESEELARRMGLLSDPEAQETKDEEKPEENERGWWDTAVLNVGELFGLHP